MLPQRFSPTRTRPDEDFRSPSGVLSIAALLAVVEAKLAEEEVEEYMRQVLRASSAFPPSTLTNTDQAQAVTQLLTISNAAYRSGGSVVPMHDDRNRAKVRLRMLRRLPLNHDNEGAAAPNARSVDRAIAFIDTMTGYRQFSTTLDDNGLAVIEFEDRQLGYFAEIKFGPDSSVGVYKNGLPSEYLEGDIHDLSVRDFIESKLGILF